MSIGSNLSILNSVPDRRGLLDAAPGDPSDGNTAWGNLTPAEQAAFYAQNPTLSAITQFGQGLFGYTTPGMIQNAVVPDFVHDRGLIAKGIDPAVEHPGNLVSQNGMDVGAHPGEGFGKGVPSSAGTPLTTANSGGGSMTFGLVPAMIGTQPNAPVVNMDITSGLLGDPATAAAAGMGGVDIGGLADAVGPSMGNDTVGFGSYGEMGGVVGADAGGGDGGGGGGAKMICTELHRQGLMPERIFLADQAFGAILVATEPHVYDGYARWARHVVRWMQRGDLTGRVVTKIAHTIATPWSREMARRMGVPAERTLAGWLLMEGGLRLCGAIGRLSAKPQLEHA